MRLTYVDESGDAETLLRVRDASPVFTLVGMSVPDGAQKSLTWDFIQMKKRFEPRLQAPGVQLSQVVNAEIKGSGLRSDIRSDSRRRRRRAFGIIDKTLGLVERNHCTLFGKIVVKTEGRSVQDTPTYARAIAELTATFEDQLNGEGAMGLMILDARTKVKNEGNVHAITTRRFRKGGGLFPHLLEAPVFGHSNTHVPLQIVDILASGVIFPLACLEYCTHLHWNVHPHGSYSEIRERFADRVEALEYRYVDATDKVRGGFQVAGARNEPPHLLLARAQHHVA